MVQHEPIRVMIVDDHDMVRQGLAMFIQAFADLALVAEASSAAEALELLQQANPNVILTDIIMPEESGLDLIAHVKRIAPQIEVIALTSHIDSNLVYESLKAGAIGFLYKDVSIDELAEAIRKAAAGKPALSLEATQALMTHVNRPDPINLTKREQEVLGLMAKGLSNPEIAGQLNVGRATVKTHVSNILGKLAVKTRVEAVIYALAHNLIAP